MSEINKLYVGTKNISGTPMNRADYNDMRGWKLPDDEDGADEGYLVEYLDGGKPNHPEFLGYISWSPKEQFENAYQVDGELSFGHAIKLMKEGCKLARGGWNGKGMFIFFVPENSYPSEGNKNNTLKGMFENDLVPYSAYLAMKTAQSNVIPWLASQTDMLTNDWRVINNSK